MIARETDLGRSESRIGAGPTELRNDRNDPAEVQHERWAHIHVNWTAVWIGSLAAFGAVVLFGLIGVALHAHLTGPEHRIVELKKLGLWTLIFSVFSAFFSAVAGGWVATKVAGILHSEPAMLHGAFVWLVTVPILVLGAGLGAANYMGGWYSGLAAAQTMPYVRPDALGNSATAAEIAAYKTQVAEYERNVKQWQEDTPRVIRNNALGTVTALLLALLGSVIGGWMASGEPMNFTHFRTRKPRYHLA